MRQVNVRKRGEDESEREEEEEKFNNECTGDENKSEISRTRRGSKEVLIHKNMKTRERDYEGGEACMGWG